MECTRTRGGVYTRWYIPTEEIYIRRDINTEGIYIQKNEHTERPTRRVIYTQMELTQGGDVYTEEHTHRGYTFEVTNIRRGKHTGGSIYTEVTYT